MEEVKKVEEIKTDSAINDGLVEAWKSTDEGKKYFQKYRDSEVTKGIDSWQKNNLSKYVSKEEYDKIITENTSKLQLLQVESAIDKALGFTKYSELLKSQIKKEAIKLTENGLIGIAEEVERVKAQYPELFTLEIAKAKAPASTLNIPAKAASNGIALSKEDIEKLPMKERLEYKSKLFKDKSK